MPRPTSSTTLQRPDLGELAYEYMIGANARGFVGMEIMPIFEVPDQSADYPIIPVESLIKTKDTKRAPRGTYNRGDWEFETGTYSCEEHGWEEPVDDVEAALYSRYFDAEMVSTEIAVDAILRNHERRVATLLEAVSNTAAVTTEWSNTSCTPRADVDTAREAMRSAYGILPNALVVSYKVFRNLLRATEITSALQYTNPIQIGSEEAQRLVLGQYFGLDVLVAAGQRDSAKKGQAATLADLWDDEYAHLIRRSVGGQRLREPVYGRTFLWFQDSPRQVVVESYREEDKRSTIIRARQHVDEAIIFAGAAYKLSNITA